MGSRCGWGAGLCKELSNSSFFSRCPKKSKSCVRKEKSPTSLPRRSDAFNSWVELFTVIDNETPDEDRLEALKAMFYSVNKINATEGRKSRQRSALPNCKEANFRPVPLS